MKSISLYNATKLNAGPKSKLDIDDILVKNFNAKIRDLVVHHEPNNKYQVMLLRAKRVAFILRNLIPDDVLIVNVPFSKSGNPGIKGKKVVALIHDIEGLRVDPKVLPSELAFFAKCDAIISHNEKMTAFLRENNITTPIVDLELFDYLSPDDPKQGRESFTEPTVVYAGTLSKSPFLFQLEADKLRFNMNLYGVGVDKDINEKLRYCGAFAPDEMPGRMEGDLGLVWDGVMDGSDEDVIPKSFTKYNNPHKLSCYLAAGLPVIVWEKAAVADFVRRHNVGYVVPDVYAINDLDFSDYAEKKKNAMAMSEKVRSGFFTVRAVKSALELIKDSD